MKAGGWREPPFYGTYLGRRADGYAGMTIGIVGLGRAGSRVAELLAPWRVRVLAADPYVEAEKFAQLGVERVDLETLLREADVVTLHCNLTAETRGLIDRARLALMKRSAVLINTARGRVVDLDALCDALAAGALAGSGARRAARGAAGARRADLRPSATACSVAAHDRGESGRYARRGDPMGYAGHARCATRRFARQRLQCRGRRAWLCALRRQVPPDRMNRSAAPPGETRDQSPNLHKTFGDPKSDKAVKAVNDVTFEVQPGEIFAFLGPNGAGKTTTIQMLTTLLRPTSGTIAIDGLDPVAQPLEVRKRFGIVFQDPSLDEELTAYENMDLHGVLYHVPRKRPHRAHRARC